MIPAPRFSFPLRPFDLLTYSPIACFSLSRVTAADILLFNSSSKAVEGAGAAQKHCLLSVPALGNTPYQQHLQKNPIQNLKL